MDLALPVSLLEDLHATAAAGDGVHYDVCTLFDPEQPDAGCSCGVPQLLRALAELMPLPAGAARPYRPEWAPAAASAGVR